LSISTASTCQKSASYASIASENSPEGNLVVTHLTRRCKRKEITKREYKVYKRTRKIEEGMQLLLPVAHPTRSELYHLVTKGFHAKVHYQMPTQLQMVYAIPNNSSIANKSAEARKLRKEKIGSAIQETLKQKSFTLTTKPR
jgi:hypothetical protein